MTTLDVSVELIIDMIVQAIMGETGGGTLSDVVTVVRGDRARPMPVLPAVWIVPQPAQMDRMTYDDETWVMPISIAALVKGDDPADAGRDSQRITALARSAALSVKLLGIPGVSLVDIVSVSFDPTARSNERNRTLFWTEAVINVTFTVTE